MRFVHAVITTATRYSLVLGFCLLVPATVFGQQTSATDKDLAVTASFFTRFELRANYADVGLNAGRFGQSDSTFYRARLGFTTKPTDVGDNLKVSLYFAPQASGIWGTTANTLTDAGIAVHEAKMRISTSRLWVDVGRFEMAYGSHLVIGNVDWHQTGRAFDGVRTRIALHSASWIDVFSTQVAEGRPLSEPILAGDQYFSGVYASFADLLGAGSVVDGYLLWQFRPSIDSIDPGVARESTNQFTLGARGTHKLGSLDLHGEAGVQVGTDAFAQQIDLGAGYHLAGTTRVGAIVFFASGDDPATADNEAWDQLYPTAHKFLGYADIIGGRSNIMGTTLGIKHSLSKLVVVAADGHLFWRPEAATESYTGAEVDVWGLYKLGKGLGLRVDGCLFSPSSSGPLMTDSLAYYLAAELRFELK